MPNVNEVPGKYDEPDVTTYANRRDYSAFKEAYLSDPYNAGIMAALDSPTAPAIIEDVAYVGQDAVRADAEGLRAALRSAGAEGRGFISSISPGMLSSMGNAHYESRHDAGMALAAELNKEYRAIVDVGHTLQIDAPDLADSWDQMNPEPTVEEYLKYVRHSVEEINESIRGIDRDKVRIHVCWGSWHGPHTTDIPFDDIVDTIFEANAGAFAFEAANPRHAWEWKIWKDRTLPEGTKLIPGVISHNTNIVEHPETVAQSIIRFAELVGPENVIASPRSTWGCRAAGQPARDGARGSISKLALCEEGMLCFAR
ncbi:epoxyalkane--coenzyme M transferase [Flaviflexus ciconiae]|uniref:Epoxyalkane--coenzyme M transferase n=1 Tax=Flaviflexus ciconiae TaxID=2496867 RepID=A0A3S9Q081_9ACTO|nr:epoxyalkane--coenzyme M transferase [Flaviflexus ciconiae]AZQ78030.1 epoxyalkane--coenzyme M transferase [Flaviflexus ciconiae]